MKGGRTGNVKKIKKQCPNLLYLKSVAKLLLDCNKLLKRMCLFAGGPHAHLHLPQLQADVHRNSHYSGKHGHCGDI